MRVKIDKALDEEIRREVADAANVVARSFLFDRDKEMVIHLIRAAVEDAATKVLSTYLIKVPWGLGEDMDVRKHARDRISVGHKDGEVTVDVRISFEGLSCELPLERAVAHRMLSEG